MRNFLLFIKRGLARLFERPPAMAGDAHINALVNFLPDYGEIEKAATVFFFLMERGEIRLEGAIASILDQVARRFDGFVAALVLFLQNLATHCNHRIPEVRTRIRSKEIRLDNLPKRICAPNADYRFLPWDDFDIFRAIGCAIGAVFFTFISTSNLHIILTQHASPLLLDDGLAWGICFSIPALAFTIFEGGLYLNRWIQINAWDAKFVALRAIIGTFLIYNIASLFGESFPFFGVAGHSAASGSSLTFALMAGEAIAGSICLSGFLHLLRKHRKAKTTTANPEVVELEISVAADREELARLLADLNRATAGLAAIWNIRQKHLADARVHAISQFHIMRFLGR